MTSAVFRLSSEESGTYRLCKILVHLVENVHYYSSGYDSLRTKLRFDRHFQDCLRLDVAVSAYGIFKIMMGSRLHQYACR